MRQETQPMPENPSGKVANNREHILLLAKQGKNYFQAENPNHVIQDFNSQNSLAEKKDPKRNDIAILRNAISSYLFEYVEEYHVSTHFVNKLSQTEMTVKNAESIPLTIMVYNVDNGTFSSRFCLTNGRGLEFPVIEHFYSNNENLTWVNEYHVYALGIAKPEEFKQINRMALKINAVIRGLCDRRQLALAEMRLQFGRYHGQVLLCDELSPFTCRFLDLSMAEESGRNRFFPVLENGADAFSELCDRLMLKV